MIVIVFVVSCLLLWIIAIKVSLVAQSVSVLGRDSRYFPDVAASLISAKQSAWSIYQILIICPFCFIALFFLQSFFNIQGGTRFLGLLFCTWPLLAIFKYYASSVLRPSLRMNPYRYFLGYVWIISLIVLNCLFFISFLKIWTRLNDSPANRDFTILKNSSMAVGIGVIVFAFICCFVQLIRARKVTEEERKESESIDIEYWKTLLEVESSTGLFYDRISVNPKMVVLWMILGVPLIASSCALLGPAFSLPLTSFSDFSLVLKVFGGIILLSLVSAVSGRLPLDIPNVKTIDNDFTPSNPYWKERFATFLCLLKDLLDLIRSLVPSQSFMTVSAAKHNDEQTAHENVNVQPLQDFDESISRRYYWKGAVVSFFIAFLCYFAPVVWSIGGTSEIDSISIYLLVGGFLVFLIHYEFVSVGTRESKLTEIGRKLQWGSIISLVVTCIWVSNVTILTRNLFGIAAIIVSFVNLIQFRKGSGFENS